MKEAKKRSRVRMIWYRFCKNKLAVAGLIVLSIIIITVILVSIFGDYSKAINQNVMERFQKPSAKHWFGTDDYGRDEFWRIIYGMRISLFMGIFTTALSVLIGSTVGAVAGYFGGMVDQILMRIVDIFMAVPMIILAIAMVATFGTSIPNILVTLAIATSPTFARLLRGQVLTVKESEYIEAARAFGSSDFVIIMKHVIPNAFPPLIVSATGSVAGTILTVSGLSFYGLGIQPPTPEWGYMISMARNLIRTYPYLTMIPAAAISITVISINCIGDGIRDAIDPKLKN